MNNSAAFTEQVSAVASRSRGRMGWIFRVFETRDQLPLMTLFRSLVLPLLEYCCQLWSPGTLGLIRQLEGVQRTFTHRISGMSGYSYWERLQHLKLYSLERRRERYVIIYTWKILQNLVPNFEGAMKIESRISERRGKMCVLPPNRGRSTARIQTLRESSLAVNGPRLFNCLPSEVRNCEGTIEGFKRKLDIYLRTVPDKPCLPSYYQSADSNSIIKQISHMRNLV